MNNRKLTSCCHVPYFADGICPKCGNGCFIFEDNEPEPLPDMAANYYPDPIPVEAKILSGFHVPELSNRWKDENEAYELNRDFQNEALQENDLMNEL